MKRLRIVSVVVVNHLLPLDAAAQPRYPVLEDVQSVDGIIRAFYDVVSGPAGTAPNRARDESLHYPGARIGMSRLGQRGEPSYLTMDLAGYYARFGGTRETPFYEWEIHRELEQFGNIAQAWSTYVTSDRPDGALTGRGVNGIQLYFDGSRWWITGWIDERERPDNPLPARYMPTQGNASRE